MPFDPVDKHIHTFLSFISMRLKIFRTEVEVGGLAFTSVSGGRQRVKVVSASINPSSRAAPMISWTDPCVWIIWIYLVFSAWGLWDLHHKHWVPPVPVPDLPILGIGKQRFHPPIIRLVHMEYVHQPGIIGALLLFLLLSPLPWHPCGKLLHYSIAEPLRLMLFWWSVLCIVVWE